MHIAVPIGLQDLKCKYSFSGGGEGNAYKLSNNLWRRFRSMHKVRGAQPPQFSSWGGSSPRSPPGSYVPGHEGLGSPLEMQLFAQTPLPAPHRTTRLQIITGNYRLTTAHYRQITGIHMTFTINNVTLTGDLPTRLVFLPQITASNEKLPACW